MKHKSLVIPLLFAICLFAACNEGLVNSSGKAVWLDELDLSKVNTADGDAMANTSIDGNSITLNGQAYERGVSVNAKSKMLVDLHGSATRFTATVGVDDEVASTSRMNRRRRLDRAPGTVKFIVVGDNNVLFESGVKLAGEEPNNIDVDLTGVQTLRLIADEAGSDRNDHADWAMAKIEYAGKKPAAMDIPADIKYILTPKPGPKPKITGPKIFGAKPGNPFLFTATATGKRPLVFGAMGLPDGLYIDPQTGQITGTAKQKGEYQVKLIAKNNLGRDERILRIVIGDTLALTPPMGWNSWNCWGPAVTGQNVHDSAKAMYDTGLINHGWSYINIDDVWMRSATETRRTENDPDLAPPARAEDGTILPNGRFPDMKGLCDYIHSLGLKAGIYIGPGPTTCQSLVASWEHEQQDVDSFVEWGFDYLKYDWCGYSSVSGNDTLEELQRPYILMGEILKNAKRDIVYSICQYGWGDVWEWGEEVGGNCWRTTGDITDTWASMSKGFDEAPHAQYAKPGHWNDPDMMILGKVGWSSNLRDARLTADEQYTHMSLWCLLNSPLLLGCPIELLDEFTLSLLTNDEVLEVNQDPLGQQARRLIQDGKLETWAKQMEDGSMSVGLFNRDDYAEQEMTLKFSDLGLDDKCAVRDLWRQKDLGTFTNEFTVQVPVHGVVLIKVTEK